MMQTSQKTIFRTGAGEIDKKLGGGVPVGSLTLVEGESDSGKSVLLQHFAAEAARNGAKVAYYTTENTTKGMVRQMESLGLDIADPFLLGEFFIYHVDVSQAVGAAEELAQLLLYHVAALPYDVSLVLVDSITNIVTNLTGRPTGAGAQPGGRTQEAAVVEMFEHCKELCDQGRTIFLAAHTYAFDERMLIRVRSMCDAHFRLKVQQIGERLVKTLEVAKVHRAERTTGNIVTFDVEPQLGIRMIPISMAKA